MQSDEPANNTGDSSLFDLNVDPQKKNSYLDFAKCSQGHPCINLCFSENCEADATLCGDQQCKCRQSHDNGKICSIGRLTKIVSMTEKKRQDFPEVMQWINKKYDEFVDWISDQKAKLCSQMNSLGLNKDQVSFLQTIYNGNCNKLTGKQMNKVVNEVNLEFKELHQITTQIKEQLEKQWQICVKKIRQEVIQINSLITKTCLQGAQVKKEMNDLKPSKVLVTENERAIVTEMLEDGNRKVSKIELLYRASDNNFDKNKFWENCNHKADTVTVLRTSFDKVIGGYTPLSWKKEKNWSHEQDSSLQSFLFSVTEDTKFKLKQSEKQHAIVHNTSGGPQFGNGYDLWISYDAKTNRSNAKIGCTYENSKVQHNTNESWQFFQGSTEDHFFMIKEWQVWQVVFQ